MNKLIELWKTDCGDCEALAPVLEEMEKEGFQFDKLNIADDDGKKSISEYQKEIVGRSKEKGYNPEYLYTPTLINPKTREVLFYPDDIPSKEEIKKLAEA